MKQTKLTRKAFIAFFIAFTCLITGTSWFLYNKYEGGMRIGQHYYLPSDFFTDHKVKELAIAAQKGNLKEIDRLVKQGVDVNAISKKGMMPLSWALSAEKINLAGLETLLKNGANPNLIAPKNTELSGDSATYFLAGGTDTHEALALVLRYGGNPNIRNPEKDILNNNKTAFIYAADQGRLENVKLLLKYGANINAKDRDGMTAFLSAVAERQYNVAYYLLQQGADYRTITTFPGSLDMKVRVDFFISRSLYLKNLSYHQIPYRTKVIKFLEAHGFKKINPVGY